MLTRQCLHVCSTKKCFPCKMWAMTRAHVFSTLRVAKLDSLRMTCTHQPQMLCWSSLRLCWHWRCRHGANELARSTAVDHLLHDLLRSLVTCRWHVHGLEERDGVLALLLLARRRPLELLLHQVEHPRQGLNSRLGVEEAKARAPSEDVHGGACVLLPARKDDLSLEERVLVGKALEEGRLAEVVREVGLRLCQLGHQKRACAVVVAKVLGARLVHVVLFAQHHGHFVELALADFARAVRSDEGHVQGLAAADGLQALVHRQRLVNRVLRHGTVRRPLASADGHEPACAHIDDVVAGELLRVARVGVWIANERTEAVPRRLDVRIVERFLEDAVALAENEVDVVHRRLRLVGDLALVVGGACEGGALPRQQVEHAAVLGEPHEAHGVRRRVVGRHQVGARPGDHDVCGLRLGHLADRVGEDARGVDHLLRANVVRLAREDVLDARADDAVVLVARLAALGQQRLDRRVVREGGSVLGGGERDVHVHARVVLLALVEDERALELAAFVVLLLDARELVEHLSARDEVRRRHRAAAACNEVVHPASDGQERNLPPAVHGHHDGQRARHEGGRVDHVLALVQVGVEDLHVFVAVAQVDEDLEQRVWRQLGLEGLGEVAQAAVD
mmetsp:Transcript_15973/g.31234  ORF Transcript_15973/g.31234 Transcript_15973/m.31234 type:complete len:620 (-) Transcript_15973:210-2069(-)